jgi:hypothetical protein
MLIWILFVASNFHIDAHGEKHSMAGEAMEELERLNAKT